MSKPEETVRVVLVRGSDERAVIDVYRTGENYYASVPGAKGHRHYHESGQVGTKTRTYYNKDIYSEVVHKAPPSLLRGIETMVSVGILNESCWHEGNALKKHRQKKKVDLLITINASDYPDEASFVILVGLAKSARLVAMRARALCRIDSAFKTLALETLGKPAGPVMFACVFQMIGTRSRYGIRAGSDYFGHFQLGGTGTASSSVGKLQMGLYFAKGDFGPAPKPVWAEPPPLPVRVTQNMRWGRVRLYSSPFDDPHAVVAGLTLFVLPSPDPDGLIQCIAINPNLVHYQAAASGRRMNYARHLSWANSAESMYLQFEWGMFGGSSKRQVTVSGIGYEIEVEGVGGEKLDFEGLPLPAERGDLPGIWRIRYDIKVTILGIANDVVR